MSLIFRLRRLSEFNSSLRSFSDEISNGKSESSILMWLSQTGQENTSLSNTPMREFAVLIALSFSISLS